MLGNGIVCHEITGLETTSEVTYLKLLFKLLPSFAFKHWGVLLVMMEMSCASSATRE